LFTMLAAIFGTGALSPITAPGLQAHAWQEGLVTAGLMSVGIAVVVSTLIFLWGLRSKAARA
jgi:(hydroxyamino)benzene mutase